MSWLAGLYDWSWSIAGHPVIMLVLLAYWRWADSRAMRRQDDAHRAEMDRLHQLYRDQIKKQHAETLAVHRNWLDDAG